MRDKESVNVGLLCPYACDLNLPDSRGGEGQHVCRGRCLLLSNESLGVWSVPDGTCGVTTTMIKLAMVLPASFGKFFPSFYEVFFAQILVVHYCNLYWFMQTIYKALLSSSFFNFLLHKIDKCAVDIIRAEAVLKG